MPLDPNASTGDNIREFRTGKTFARTARKFGAKRANQQAVAVALHTEDEGSIPRSTRERAARAFLRGN